MGRVLVTDDIDAEGLELLGKHAQVDMRSDLKGQALLDALPGYHGWVVRSKTKVTAECIAAAPDLAVIGRVGTGVDNIDVNAATHRGVVVVNAPFGNTISVAEHTIGMMLALARHIPRAHAALCGRRWEKSSLEGLQLAGKVLGIAGLGHIGMEVARRAQAFDMQVIAYDPFVTAERAAQLGVRWTPWNNLLRASDFLTLHLPLTAQTRNLIGRDELRAMKSNACLINCARGGLIDECALAEALSAGHLAGAALDVFENEPPWDCPLLDCERVVLTPHLAGSTAEAQRTAALDVAQQVVDVLAGRVPRYPVNAPALSEDERRVVGPYLDLAERLASFYTQYAGNHLRSIEVACAGETARQRMDLVASSALVGLLRGTSEEPVNWVNALVAAEERGIAVAVRSEPLVKTAGWSNLVELRLQQGNRSHVLAGTMLRGEPHIVQIDGFWLDFVARGVLLVSEHVEQPGILGRMGTLLGDAGVNISFVQVGANERGGRGLMVLGLDDPVTRAVQEQVLALPSVRSAQVVCL